MFDCFKKLMCTLGHHDFLAVARWCTPNRSVTIEEYHCTRCGEDAYHLATFNPATCSRLTRFILTSMPETCGDLGLIAGVGRDRRATVGVVSDAKEKGTKKTQRTSKPGRTAKTAKPKAEK